MKATEITDPGFYWWKSEDDGVIEIVQVIFSYKETELIIYYFGREDEDYLHEATGEFFGPIDVPEL